MYRLHDQTDDSMLESVPALDPLALTREEYTQWLHEIQDQPAWRAKADREMDYVDGNQLDSELLQKMRSLGMPPAIEPLIGPAIDAVLGLQVKTRTDWRVMPDNDQTTDDLAEALNFKLNQAERLSKADRACSDAHRPQVAVGIGWVEVSRNPDPFRYPYRCQSVNRNEVWWDWLAKEPDLIDARYLVRRRWTDVKQVELTFPEHLDLIRHAGAGWLNFDIGADLAHDGGGMTSLAMGLTDERGWSIEEMEWRDGFAKRVCLFEVWYRRWVRATVLRTPDGRIVEYDEGNEAHVVAVASGAIEPESAVIAKVRRSIWMGPHCLGDGPSPYRHGRFPYVPFWGKREDRTGIPIGLARGMMFMQDNVNAMTSKIRWGLSAVRTTRTEGIYAGTDEQFRNEIGRVDADIILSAREMAQPGATFKVERDFQLNEQQYKVLVDSRTGIQRTSGISAGLQGSTGNASSGIQEATQVEQATQSLADLVDNFSTARADVGDLLLSLIAEDMIGKPQEVRIAGSALKDDRVVALNQPAVDEATGVEYLTNDVERAKLKVTLSDVPSTPSFRSQQLSAMSEAFKSMPTEYQVVALPYLLALMDMPNRDDIIKEIREASTRESPDQIEQRIKDAVKAAGLEIKQGELTLRSKRQEAEISEIMARAVKIGVEASYAAMQAAGAIVQAPQIAPVADVVMQTAGYQAPTPVGDDPNFPMLPGVAVPPQPAQQNTSPQLPPVPQQPDSPMLGIETARTSDNNPIAA